MNDQLRAVVRLVIYGVIFAVLVAWKWSFAVAERDAEINGCVNFYGDRLSVCPTPGPGETP